MSKSVNRLLALPMFLLVAVVMLGLASPSAAQTESSRVSVLKIDGVINPLTARYLSRGLEEARAAQADIVIIKLNTPGGLESSMREMSQDLLNSPVPIVVYVTPPGGRAASAGMFITIAAHVAAMAPGTNIGAAHPVGVGEQTDPAMSEKLVNDAAALARSIATVRGKNAVWAEQAVRESVSITAEEALDQNVIDLVAADMDSLLRQLDGRTVTTVAGEVTLQTANVTLADHPMTLPEQLLQIITDPNIAYILFTIGVIGIIAELYNPGSLFPGITGAIALVLAFVAFGSLPLSLAGLLLLLLAIGLFIAELYTEGTGVLAVGGLIAFVLGSLLLYTPITPVAPSMPEVAVSPILVAIMASIIGGFFLVVLRALMQARVRPVTTGIQGLIGHTGQALSDLSPRGTVKLDSEVWSAIAAGEPINAGQEVQVVGVEGVTLRVTKR